MDEKEDFAYFSSPLGLMTITAQEDALTGLWFTRDDEIKNTEARSEILDEVKRWLEMYFAGECPDFTPKLRFSGTKFRETVWEILTEIPYGKTRSYGDIAREAAKRMGKARMSAQAAGGAVGHNPICLIIPCHRVIGADGSLTGYAEGLWRKEALLKLEGIIHGKAF